MTDTAWNPDAKTIRRFEDKFMPEPNSGCWLWVGAMLPRRGSQLPRGVFCLFGKTTYASRAAHLIYKGPIPAGMFVCHTCDMPPCVNPDHLFLGTPADNTHDMIKKGRSIADRHPLLLRRVGKQNNWSVGAENPNAKLTPTMVRKIRRDARSSRVVARDYGVGQMAILNIKNGKRWTSVT